MKETTKWLWSSLILTTILACVYFMVTSDNFLKLLAIVTGSVLVLILLVTLLVSIKKLFD